ncbi:unnamed protein product [Fusarium graminearum]|nr:unnamed protein product [Fusarium graminearum]
MKAAVVQAEPVWFDLAKTVEKTCKFIKEAASNGANIVAFPELWLPGYPTWIWARPMDLEMSVKYIKNSMRVDSEEMQAIQSCAAENNIVVCVGFSESCGGSVYIAQCTIDSNGEILMTRRKLKPFHIERTLFGDGGGKSLDNVASTTVGRVGQLSCGEHFNPLLNFNTFSQGEDIHCAAWPCVPTHLGGPEPYSMSDEAVASISRVYSIQAQCYTLHSTTVITEPSIEQMGTKQAPVFNVPGGGNAKIFAPDGRQLTEDLPATEEGMVMADLDLDQITMHKSLLDICGHNGRPELLCIPAMASDASAALASLPPHIGPSSALVQLVPRVSNLPYTRQYCRTSKPKVRSGCRTCKKRRVKCDEGKPTCASCTNGDFVCDGYETALSTVLWAPVQTPHRNHPSLAPPVIPGLTSQSVPYLDAFRFQIASELSGSFYMDFCQGSILVGTHQDGSICQLALALGALTLAIADDARETKQHIVHARPSSLRPWGVTTIKNGNHAASLKHYMKGVSSLRDRLRVDPARIPVRTILITTILMALYEILQGNYKSVDAMLRTITNLLHDHHDNPMQAELNVGSVEELVSIQHTFTCFSIMSQYSRKFTSPWPTFMSMKTASDIEPPTFAVDLPTTILARWRFFNSGALAYIGQAHGVAMSKTPDLTASFEHQGQILRSQAELWAQTIEAYLEDDPAIARLCRIHDVRMDALHIAQRIKWQEGAWDPQFLAQGELGVVVMEETEKEEGGRWVWISDAERENESDPPQGLYLRRSLGDDGLPVARIVTYERTWWQKACIIANCRKDHSHLAENIFDS